jgi:hypothetical protein
MVPMVEARSCMFFNRIETSWDFELAWRRLALSSLFMETSRKRLADLKESGIVVERRIALITMRSFVEIEILNGRRI